MRKGDLKDYVANLVREKKMPIMESISEKKKGTLLLNN